MHQGFGFWTVAIGYLILAIPATAMVTLGAIGALGSPISMLIAGVLLVVLGAVLMGLRFEFWGVIRDSDLEHLPRDEMLWTGIAIVGGTVCTLALVVEFALSSIVAAGIVGIGASILIRSYAIPIYCGAFVGMTSPLLFTTYIHGFVAAGIASVVFIVAQPVFFGLGGKLGTTAFVGAIVTVFITPASFQGEPIAGSRIIVFVVVCSILAAVATFILHAHTPAGPVFASGIIGMIGGSILPWVFADPGTLMAAGVFAASFAGMTDPVRIPNELWIALSGALVGLIVIYTSPYLGGSGGKLGTIAFASCLAVHGFLGVVHLTRIKIRPGEFPVHDVT